MIQTAYRSADAPAKSLWRLYFLLGAAQAVLTLGLVVGSPSAVGSGLPLGLSPFRMALGVGILALSGLFAALLAASNYPARFSRLWEGLSAWLDRPAVWGGMALAAGLIFFTGVSYLALLPDLTDEAVRAVAERLLPPVALAAGLGAQTLLALLILRHGRELFAAHPQGRLFYLTSLAIALVFAGWAWAAQTIIPGEAERIGWNDMGVPLVGLQVMVAWLCSAALMGWTVFSHRQTRPPAASKPRWWSSVELGLCLLIWLAAVVAWQSTPVTPNWFLTEPTAPNFETYPNSDARAYDSTAQTALIGEGFIFYNSPFVRRALLAAYMTGLHLLGGQDYSRVIFLQILVLALFPVVLYAVARRIHNRYSGMLLAGLVILREANAIRLSADITTSNVKLLMADMPATLLASAFIYLVILWLKNIHNRLLALACGGVLGLAMLVRLEMVLFVVPVALIAAFVLWPKRSPGIWLQSGLLAVLGIALVISPWVYRNYRRTGMIFIDNPYFFSGLFMQRYSPGSEDIEIEDPDAAPSNLLPTPLAIPTHALPPVKVLPAVPEVTPTPTVTPAAPAFLERKGQTLQFFRQNIGSLARVVLGHALNSQVQSLLILPNGAQGLEGALGFVSHRSPARAWAECCTGRETVRSLPYWRNWRGSIPLRSAPGLLLNLVLIALGVQFAWNRQRWAGIAPIALGVAYFSLNALFRNSGGRYILPVDWTVLLYFSIGLAQVTQSLFRYLTGRTIPEEFPSEAGSVETAGAPSGGNLSRSKRLPAAGAFLAVMLGFFLLGCLPPLMERSLPVRYDQATLEPMVVKLLNAKQVPGQNLYALHLYLANGAQFMYGRAMYPRYFPPNEGDDVARRNPFAPRPYPRIAFFLAGPVAQAMSVPVDKKPASFPNGSDVLLVVCPERDVLAAAVFAPNGELDKVYLRAPFPTQNACPLPEESVKLK